MRRYLAPRWLLGHLLVAAVAVTFLRLGWWQWEHARQGNMLSYGYALQWPLFAAFGVYFWIHVLRDRVTRAAPPVPPAGVDHDVPPTVPPDHRQATVGVVWSFRPDLIPGVPDDSATPAVADRDNDRDHNLAAYNEMLAWLNADPRRRHADYRRATLDNPSDRVGRRRR